jgi:hypothetical protein
MRMEEKGSPFVSDSPSSPLTPHTPKQRGERIFTDQSSLLARSPPQYIYLNSSYPLLLSSVCSVNV